MSSAPTLPVTPATRQTSSVTTAAPTGNAKLRRRFAAVARRHAISGPMPDSSTSTSASGVM